MAGVAGGDLNNIFLQWVGPSGTVAFGSAATTLVTTNPQNFTQALPTTGPGAELGRWTARTANVSNAAPRVAAAFRVPRPAVIGVHRDAPGSVFFFRNTNTTGFGEGTIPFGLPGDIGLVGDWDGDGVLTPGVYRPSDGTFYLANSPVAANADLVIPFGPMGGTPIVGDWNGDGTTKIGIHKDDVFSLRNSNTPGPADLTFVYGLVGDTPVVGDWDGDGVTTIGVYRDGVFYLRNSNTAGDADLQFAYGLAGDTPIAGDWNADDGKATIGIYRSSAGVFYLRNSNTTGVADLTIPFGISGDQPATTLANQAPVLAAGGTLSYTANQAATAIDTTITLTDMDSATLVGATAQITGNCASGEDVLSFSAQNGISGVYTAASCLMTLSGRSAVASYQAALRSVKYNDTSGSPSPLVRTVTWQVNDGAVANNLSNTATSTINVQQPPAITSASTATFAPGLAGQTFTVTTTGFPTNTITRTGTLPGGVTFTDNGNNTATIAGTPAAGTQTPGSYAWIITAANGVPPNAVQNPFTFNIVCPTITVSGTIPTLTFNTAMATATFTQGGGSGTIAWSSSGLPTGVTINGSSGDVTGTPTVTGTFNATITATDAGGCTGSKNQSVTVNRPPAITSAATATFAPGLAGQTFTVTTTGFPTNTITRTGTLPSGVTFTDNGNNTATIAGTPAAGTQTSSPYAWVVTAANGVLPNAVQNPFTFNVVCPSITVSGTIPALTFNTAMATATFTRVGGNGTITWSSSGLPGGTAINSANGQVTGTPTVTGTFNVTITATDVGACPGSKNQSVTVAPVAMGDAYSGLVDNTQLVITGGTTANPATPFVGAAGKITANDLPSGGVSATAGTFATSAGGSVTIANDGTFIYTPKANPTASRTTSDSFTYTVFSNTGGGAAVTSAAATVNLTLVGRVWYVLNTAGGGGNGQSQSPFNALSAAIAASTAGASATDTDTIYVYQGDGMTAGLATASILKSLQSFIGQGVALVVNSNTLVAAGGFPLIGNTVTLATNVTVNGIDMSTATASGLVGTSTTGLSVTVRNLTTTTGTAVNLNGTNGTVTVTSVTASGGTTNISLTNVAGTVTMNGGALSGASGRAIDISGAPGTANITYAGTIANSGTGIGVANKTSGTVTFSGSTKTLNTGANTAVTLSSNTGATINFSGGGLAITTTSGPGFSATGGGTVNVTGTGNTISSGTGTALNVTSTTIGASGSTFRSISAGTGSGSAGNGIVLDTTGSSGGLTVTGNSSGFCGGSVSPAQPTDAADCTGGTIQHKTGTDNSTTAGIGIYLNSTSNVSLTRMQLNDFDNFAIRGSNVTGFTLSNSHISGQNGNNDAFNEGSISFDGLTGSASLTSVNISGGWEDNLRLSNTTGSLNRLTLSNSTIGANSATFGNAALNMMVQGAGAVMNVTVDGCIFTGSRSHFVQYLLNGSSTPTGDFVFTNNTITQSMASIAGAGGVFVSQSANASPTFTFNIQNNIIHSGTQTITGNDINVSHEFGGTYSGTIDGNTIGTAGVVGSGSTQGNGIAIIQVGGGTYTVHVTNNTVRRYNNLGISVQVGDNTTGGQGTVNVTMTGNTVAEPDSFALHGVDFNIGTTAGDSMFVCATIGGAGALKNTLTGSGVVANGGFDLETRQRFLTTIRLPGYGGANNSNSSVTTFLSGQNTVSTVTASNSVASGGGGYVNGAACP